MAGTAKSKKTAAKAKKPASSKSKKQAQAKKQDMDTGFMREEVILIASFAVAVLLFLSNFHLCGMAGDYLRKVQLGIFGMIGFLAPVLLFLGTCFGMSNQGNPIAALKMAAAVTGTLVLCGLTEMVFGGGYEEGQKIMDAFIRSSESGLGGGLIGGALAQGLGSILGVVGTYLVLLVILAICCVCVTEKSLVALVKRGGGKAYQYAKEDASRRREIHEERREERLRQKEEKARLREEQRVRGVNLNATKLEGYSQDQYEDLDYYDEDYDETYDEAQEDSYGSQAYDNGGYYDEEYVDDGEYDDGFYEERGGGGYGHSRSDGRARRAVSETASGNMPQEHQEDIFTGEISLPPQYLDEEEDVPFDDEDVMAVESALRAAWQDTADQAVMDEEWDTLDAQGTCGAGAGKRADTGQRHEQEYEAVWGHNLRQEPSEAEDPGMEAAYGPNGGQTYEADFEREGSPVEPSGSGTSYEDDPMPDSITHWVPELPKEEILRAPKAAPAAGGSLFDRDLSSLSQESRTWEAGSDGQSPSKEVFEIPQESKRVVTASGKIIENDTEALKKKLDMRRMEAKEEHGSDALGVAAQIREKEIIKKEYQFPPVTLLKRASKPTGAFSEQEYKDTAIKLQQTLKNFGVGVTVTNISCGPSVTRYELRPEQGVKVSKIVGLADDIKLSLAAEDIRIEAPIPGRSAVGIEVPNKENTTVYLREIFESESFKTASSSLSFAVGKDIGGQVVVTDIAKMPHLLIAGATGSGKSVCINTLIMSIIFKASPDDVKLIMVDPKVVELSAYNGIPHLLIPVVTDPKKASGALNWAVAEMMSRYDKFAKYNMRNLKGYNAKIESIKDIQDEDKPQKMPQIVIIIDELADLMMVSPGEVEDAICRLAQLARAAGIHLVIATQRPSVNVITGLIKANVPSRIAFAVSSGVDSRTIIDMYGAEKLLGKGDMLFYPSGVPKPQRVQGAFVSDQEVADVVEFLVAQGMETEYQPDIESRMAAPAAAGGTDAPKNNGRDEYFEQAGKFIIEKEKASIGMLQRMYKIGFNRAARIMDQLAEFGVVGEEEGTKPRKVLMTVQEFEDLLSQE